MKPNSSLALITRRLFIGISTLATAALALAVETTPSEPQHVYGISEILHSTNKPFGKQITLEGFPSAVCKRSGKKAWLHDTNSEAAGTIRVERTGTMKAFNQDVVGKTIRVTGVLKELRIDKDYVDAWEARVKASLKKTKTGDKEDGCTEECQENVSADKTFKSIEALRKKIEKSPKGYLSGLWVDGTQWTLVEAKN